jgi:hypothetical protein
VREFVRPNVLWFIFSGSFISLLSLERLVEQIERAPQRLHHAQALDSGHALDSFIVSILTLKDRFSARPLRPRPLGRLRACCSAQRFARSECRVAPAPKSVLRQCAEQQR